MKKLRIIIPSILMCIFFLSNNLSAQDIIVLNNGDLIKSKVTEIGLATIKYQRFDQDKGPIYSLTKSEIFAIHYSDGTRDLFSRGDAATSNINKVYSELLLDTMADRPIEETFVKKDIFVHAGINLQKIYSPANELGISDYKISSLHWNFNVGYGVSTNTVIGVSFSKGSYIKDKTFTDDYNFTQTTFNIIQNISSFSVWSRYYLKTKNVSFRPYAVGGLSFNRSNVTSVIHVTTESDKISFDRGGVVMDVMPKLKVGFEFDVFDFLLFFTEVGYDVTLANIGVGYRFDK